MAKKRKVNWQELQQFWTKNFGLSADDVFKVLEKEYFDKNYLGSKNKTTFRKTALKFYDESSSVRDPYGRLAFYCLFPVIKRKNFDNLLNIWKKLPFINLKQKISYKQKQLHHAAQKVLKKEQKEKLLRKKFS